MVLTIQSKSGSGRIPLLIFEVLFVITVGWITINVATQFAQSESLQQIEVSQDVAMLMNLLVGSTGDALVEYPANLTQYRLILTSDAFIIRHSQNQEYEQTRSTFILPEGYTAQTHDGVVLGEEHVCFEKKDRTITLRKCPQQEAEV